MNSLSMGKYRPAIILTLALTVFLASCTPDDPTEWVVTTFAGTGIAGAADTSDPGVTPVVAAQFDNPLDVAADSDGNIYVADADNHRIRKITSEGVVSTFAGSGTAGSADGAGLTAAQFSSPGGVAVFGTGADRLVYVADTGNNLIRKITITTVNDVVTATVSTLAGSTGMSGMGSADGDGTAAQFGFPTGVAVDSSGNVYVADYFNHIIRKIVVANDGTGTVSTLAGAVTDRGVVSGTDDGIGAAAKFSGPFDVAVDSDNNLYVADANSSRIRKITIAANGTATVNTIAGDGTAAQFDSPEGVAVDSSGNVYVADADNNRIRKITSEGKVYTLAGTGTAVQSPTGVAVVGNNIYVADAGNNRIRKIELK